MTDQGGAEVIPIGHLADVAGTYAAWQRASDREKASRALFREAVLAARDQEATLQTIADALGMTRQAIHKLIREQERQEDHEAAYAARYSPDNARRSLGRSGGYARPQCGGCKRFLKRADDVCPSCGYAGHGGYVGVPAPTSHLERYR
jgi:hypothetical protein